MMSYRFPVLSAPNFSAGTVFHSSTSPRADLLRALGADLIAESGSGQVHPSADAVEDSTGFVITFDVPGISPEDIEVLTEDNVLTVSGSVPESELKDGERQLFSERPRGAFTRKLRFPKSANLSSIVASYANGVLQLRVAKVEPVQPRRVPVTVGAAIDTTPSTPVEQRSE